MSTEITKDEAQFVHEGPTFDYDKIYKCFEKRDNGLLFRLVNTEKKQWAFYNDTSDMTMKVSATFGPGSQIKGLRRTRVTTIAKEDGTIDSTCEQQAVLEIEPFRTELFIEGTVTGLSMNFQSEAAPATDVSFEYRRPTVPYDKIYKCFKNQGNGLLFRLVDEHKRQWHFYNDTKDYLMKVTVEFAKGEDVSPMGKTKVEEGTAKHYPDGVVYTLEVAPGKTEAFIEGTPSAYSLGFAADPVNNDKPVPASEVHYENGSPDYSIVDAKSHVYKCFKEHGNGLLFRLVDEVNELWAFYNDTTEYIMKANVKFAPGQTYELSEHAREEDDPEEPGVKRITMEIPPTTTLIFVRGLPHNYVVSFSAESANKAAPEAHPHYENGEPDRSVVDFQDVYKCFKDRGNGLLFRLVSADQRCWGFYNDTPNLYITVRVTFDGTGKITALGKTRVEDDLEAGPTHVLEIDPMTTEPFASGDIGGYSIKFTATSRK